MKTHQSERRLSAHSTPQSGHEVAGKPVAPSGLPEQCGPCGDGFYVVQPLWSDGTLCGSETRFDSEAAAIKAAADERHSARFEGSAVRVITADGEIVVSFEVAS